jgi:hypothetical protein
MRRKMITLYSWALPLALLPVLDFSFGQIPSWVKGTEFRGLMSGLLTDVFTQIANVFILIFVDGIFGSNLSG